MLHNYGVSSSLYNLETNQTHETLMEDRKAFTIATSSLLSLIIVIIITRFSLKQSKPFYFILGADLAAILAVIYFILFRFFFNRRRKTVRSQLSMEGKELGIEYSFLRKIAGVPTKFRYKELEEATDRFSSLIGRGSSASVFKGILSDGSQVAVKRIEGDIESGEREFKSEVAAVASAQHLNLVRLIGYCCVPKGPRFIVYDFIPNGSLDKWIFPNSQGRCLPWDSRCRVAVDVARALSYLHNDCRSRILHLDVKPENILLDENYRAIVSDFGLSKKMKWDQSRVLTTIRGTKGYLAPEWLLENGISEKSDIFSFGMVLLEIIGGRRNVKIIENSDRKFEYYPEIVSDRLREGKIMEVVDERVVSERGIDENEVRKMVYVAMWCIQEKARLRPSMGKVVEMLEGRVVVEEPPQTQMVIVDVLCIDDDDDDKIEENRKKKYAVYARATMNCDLPFTSISRSITMPILSGR